MPHIIFFFKIRMIFSLVALTGLDKCCITSAYLQWLCHSGERPGARGPLVWYLGYFRHQQKAGKTMKSHYSDSLLDAGKKDWACSSLNDGDTHKPMCLSKASLNIRKSFAAVLNLNIVK